jgi:hypothetical protein
LNIRILLLFRILIFGFRIYCFLSPLDRQSLLGSHQHSWWFDVIN